MNSQILQEAPEIIRGFLGYMQTIKGKSAKTVEEYYLDLRTFFRYYKQAKGLAPKDCPLEEISIADVDLDLIRQVTLTDVFEFMNYVMSERENTAATRARKSSSLRMFFKYLTNKTGQLEYNPLLELDTPKLKKSLPKYITLEQSLELLNSVDGPYKERDYCILTLFLNCGMRLSELVGLNVGDVRLEEKTLKVTGKGNKERVIYMNDACITALKRYLAVRPVDGVYHPDRNALFFSHLKKRMGVRGVQLMVEKYLEKAGLGGQGYSVHKLRHTAATLMYQHGNVDIRVLKDILGHENLGTTEIYTHLSDEQMAKAAASNPLAKVKPR